MSSVIELNNNLYRYNSFEYLDIILASEMKEETNDNLSGKKSGLLV